MGMEASRDKTISIRSDLGVVVVRHGNSIVCSNSTADDILPSCSKSAVQAFRLGFLDRVVSIEESEAGR
jgi:hypothetical protein